MPSVNPGNHNFESGLTVVGLGNGFDEYTYEGSALITNTAAIVWDIRNVKDEAPIIQASAASPAWISSTSFRIPEIFTGANGDRLKLASSLADTNPYTALSEVIASTFLQRANVLSTAAPWDWVAVTANTTFRLYLCSGTGTSNPAGASLIPATPALSPLPAAPLTRVRIPVRISWRKRSAPPIRTSRSVAQSAADLGI